MSQSLTDEQTAAVRSWADEGADLPAIQKRLGDEFEVHLTFMDTRFLIADLGIELKAEEEEDEAEVEAEAEAAAAGSDQAPADSESDAAAPTGEVDDLPGEQGAADAPPEGGPVEKVTVTISELQRPGMMANGNVTFANGQVAEWYLDQMGQLGMNPNDPEFRPSPQQMLAFQKELQRVAQEKGMA